MALASVLFEILHRPTIWDVWMDLMLFVAPLWVAVLVGVFVGWAWKPSWATFRKDFLELLVPKAGSPCIPTFNSLKFQLPSCFSAYQQEAGFPSPSAMKPDCSSPSQLETAISGQVNKYDLRHLMQLVDVTDGGPSWIQMMDRNTPKMSYKAWRRDPETGPPQYRSSTVFEDATPEIVRDFFWDDGFRLKWDDMLIHASTMEDCPITGTMLVHWVRKFPFFCSDREYIIGRRIWEHNRSYYCVTKGVPNSSVPRRSKPRRVDLYYSSWCIRAVESKRGSGELTACEVLLFHHEDMGIPWELAKLGVRQGMWGAVRKIERGFHAYHLERASGALPSHYAVMAQISPKVGEDCLSLKGSGGLALEEEGALESSSQKPLPLKRNIPKFLVIGGAVVLACSLDRGLLTKAVIFGVARRFAKLGVKF